MKFGERANIVHVVLVVRVDVAVATVVVEGVIACILCNPFP